MAKGKLFYILLGALGMSLLAVSTYFYYHWKGIDYTLIKFLKTYSITLGIFIAIGIFIYFIFWFKDRKDEVVDKPREIVSSTRIKEIWKEECILNTGIPHRFDIKTKKIIPLNPKAIIIENFKGWTDEEQGTSDRFCGFEAYIFEGTQYGSHYYITRRDLGEKHIRDNWDEWEETNKTQNMLSFDPSKFPRTSPLDYRERLNIARLSLMDEGYTPQQLGEWFDPMTQQQIRDTSKYERNNGTTQPIQELPQITENEDEKTNSDDIKKELEKYRKNQTV